MKLTLHFDLRPLKRARSSMQKAFLKTIKLYQLLISPFLGKHCRFYPSCSGYTQLAIEKYGLIQGLKKGFWRIARCHPFNEGGIDLP